MKKYDENRAFALLDKIGFTRVAGSSEELKAAKILKAECESFGLSAVIEPFEIESAEVEATFEILEPYRKSYTVRGYQCAESTAADGLTADFVYVENALPVDLLNVKGKIVLVNGFLRVPLYRSLMEAGAAAVVTSWWRRQRPHRRSGSVQTDRHKSRSRCSSAHRAQSRCC